MKRTNLNILLLVLVSLLISVLPACSGGSNPANQTSPGQSGNTATTAAMTTGTGLPKPVGMPDIADMKSLPSYRLAIMTKVREGDDAGSITFMKYEWVKNLNAEHAWMEAAGGKLTELYIKIGDKYWMYAGLAGMGWIEQPPQTTTASSIKSDLVSQIKQVQQDVKNSSARFDKKGTDTVNNVRCLRYEFEYFLTTEIPNLGTGGATKADSHVSGDVWIADQSGLPGVIIKSISATNLTMAGKKTVIDSEQNLTDIGANITIKPPEGAIQVPTGVPSVPTGIPALTQTTQTTPLQPTITIPPTATTPSATGDALTFSDNFQGVWNSSSVWTDPNDDVTVSFKAHAGFLRLTVPDGNDLAGAANYDAPRLLFPQTGDFSLETLIEFDPRETYQGAGLLVWQDEDTFLRLEFGFGGMGGIEKNVAFLRQETGGLGLEHSVDLPETLKRLELRLQRNGNQFTAWWRQVGDSWQKMGSTELMLDSIVDIGITQVTQYTESQISADFDYIKIFSH